MKRATARRPTADQIADRILRSLAWMEDLPKRRRYRRPALTKSERAEANFAAFAAHATSAIVEPGPEEPNVLKPRVPLQLPARMIETMVDSLERDVENCIKYHDRFCEGAFARLVRYTREAAVGIAVALVIAAVLWAAFFALRWVARGFKSEGTP